MSDGDYRFVEHMRKPFLDIKNTLQQRATFSDALWTELEEKFLAADFGPSTSMWLIQRLQQRVKEEDLRSGAQVYAVLCEELIHLLGNQSSLRFA